jgi:hypothetical protein
LAECLLGLKISSSQIYRLTNYYGEVIGADLSEIELESEPLTKDDVVYAQADGAMILTDDGYWNCNLLLEEFIRQKNFT